MLKESGIFQYTWHISIQYLNISIYVDAKSALANIWSFLLPLNILQGT